MTKYKEKTQNVREARKIPGKHNNKYGAHKIVEWISYVKSSDIFTVYLPHKNTNVPHVYTVLLWVAYTLTKVWNRHQSQMSVKKMREGERMLKERKKNNLMRLPFAIVVWKWTQGKPHICIGFATFLVKLFTHSFSFTAEPKTSLLCVTQKYPVA